MMPDWVSNPGPLTYESGALPIALRGPARNCMPSFVARIDVAHVKRFACFWQIERWSSGAMVLGKLPVPERPTSLDGSRAGA